MSHIFFTDSVCLSFHVFFVWPARFIISAWWLFVFFVYSWGALVPRANKHKCVHPHIKKTENRTTQKRSGNHCVVFWVFFPPPVDIFSFFFFLTIICSRDPTCSPDSLCKALGKYRCVEKDTDLLLSTLSAMQEKAQHLECNLSAETRIKLDLFSALGDTRRQLEIAQGSSLSLLWTPFISLCRSETGQTRR